MTTLTRGLLNKMNDCKNVPAGVIGSAAMNHEDPRHLLDDVRVLKHPCDLDLLLFFSRHPRALVTSEQLSSWLGYELAQIAESLDVLLSAGILTRTQNPAHAARLYVLSTAVVGGGSFPSLLHLASTRTGRLAIVGCGTGGSMQVGRTVVKRGTDMRRARSCFRR